MSFPIRFAGTLLIAVLALTFQAQAHEPGLSQASIRHGENELQVSLRFDADDWSRLERAGAPDAAIRLELGDRRLAPLRAAQVHRAGDHVDLVLSYPATGPERLRFSFSGFRALRLGHRQYVELRDANGDRIVDTMLQESAPGAWLD